MVQEWQETIQTESHFVLSDPAHLAIHFAYMEVLEADFCKFDFPQLSNTPGMVEVEKKQWSGLLI